MYDRRVPMMAGRRAVIDKMLSVFLKEQQFNVYPPDCIPDGMIEISREELAQESTAISTDNFIRLGRVVARRRTETAQSTAAWAQFMEWLEQQGTHPVADEWADFIKRLWTLPAP